jgi:hypothetical protein
MPFCVRDGIFRRNGPDLPCPEPELVGAIPHFSTGYLHLFTVHVVKDLDLNGDSAGDGKRAEHSFCALSLAGCVGRRRDGYDILSNVICGPSTGLFACQTRLKLSCPVLKLETRSGAFSRAWCRRSHAPYITSRHPCWTIFWRAFASTMLLRCERFSSPCGTIWRHTT